MAVTSAPALFSLYSFICNFQRLVQNIHALLQVFLCDDEGRDDQDRVPVGIEEQAIIEAVLS